MSGLPATGFGLTVDTYATRPTYANGLRDAYGYAGYRRQANGVANHVSEHRYAV
ncbi:MAG: hypothetical protein M1420_02950 [Actinobacteria bacterium]|jgi:hypothetical protein|nr:hypothetical protein [Actinomycetota bacterium]